MRVLREEVARRSHLLAAVAAMTLAAFVLLTAASPNSPATAPKSGAQPRFKSPLGLAVDQSGRYAYVALHGADALAVVDLKEGKGVREIPVGRRPVGVAVGGEVIYVTCEADDVLVILDRERWEVRKRTAVGQAPQEVALSPDGGRVYVVCRDSSELWWRDIATGASDHLPLPGWPERLALSPAHVPVAYPAQVGADRATLAYVAATGKGTTLVHQPGMNNLRGLAWTPGSPLASDRLVVHQRPKAHVPATQVAQGWVFTNAVRLSTLDLSEAAILDEPHRGYADPSDIVVTPDGRHAFIAAAGANAILVLDLKRLTTFLRKRATQDHRLGVYRAGGDDSGDSDDLTASRHYVTARLPTQANPRRLVLSGDGKTLVVSNHLADSLTVVDVESLQVTRHIPLGGSKPDAARRGEILFHSGKTTFQGQFTCASCHPNGGSDGLNWDLTRDGVGNFKNTKSLLGIKDSAPFGWHGSSPTLADRVRGTLRTLHRHKPAGTEVEDLVAYLESLPPPRPLPPKEADPPAISRGKALFAGKGQCSNCHHRTALDDGKSHDVGTRGPTDTQDRFDTPALRGVVRTAPYLHDGRAATLEEVFTKHNPRQWHGAAHTLSAEEMADLVAYLKSL